MNTIAGRVVHQLFVENLFVSALTFHGGIGVIGYPWGSYNHVRNQGQEYQSNEAPDYKAFQTMGAIMKSEAGGDIYKDYQTIKAYVLGDMASTVYPVRGGMEDWAYGAGWDYADQATNVQCEPVTYELKNVNVSQQAMKNVRSAMYLIETDDNKIPPEFTLGGRQVK